MSIYIQGAAELRGKLAELSEKVGGKIVTKAVASAMQIVKADARAGAPVDTGNLQRSVRVRAGKYMGNRFAKVTSGAKQTKRRGAVEYARFVEKGTSKMKARPFLGPALTKKKNEVVDKVIEELRAGIDQIAKGK